jgi:uncharacterized membrane protein
MLGPILVLAGGILVAGPILALVAFVQNKRYARDLLERLNEEAEQIAALQKHLEAASRRIAKLERAAGVEPTTATAAPTVPSPPASPHPGTAQAPGAVPPGPTRRAAEADFDLPMEPPVVASPGPAPSQPAARPAAGPVPPARPAAPPPRPGAPEPPVFSGSGRARPPSPPIDWERWIGVRGAAVVGAVALGLAGLLFFRYSIEHGLITPSMRVVLGTLVGLGCVVGSEWLRGRGYRQTAEGVTGGGIVVLYAAFWAAHVLYGLVPMAAVFVLMVLVTAACCLLAVRHGSLLVAVLGLVGGFATPLLLSSGADRPIGLFGYVLLLDLGLLAVGHKRQWPSLGVLSLLGTVVLQGLWIVMRMGPARLFLGLVILTVFALLFVLAGRLAGGRKPRGSWIWSQVGAIAFPFLFAFYFATRVGLGPHLYPIAILLVLLDAGAAWVAREQRVPGLGMGAATASVAVVGAWLIEHALTTPLAWELVAAAIGIALVFHLFVERDPGPAGADGPAPAAIIAACGLFFVLLCASAAASVPMTPWLVGWAGLAALLYRHAACPGRGLLQPVAAVGIGLGLSIQHLVHSRDPGFPAPPLFLSLLLGASLALHGAALLRREALVAQLADHAAALLPVVLLLGLTPAPFSLALGPLPALGASLLLGFLAGVAATRLEKGAWCLAAVVATLLVHVVWTFGRVGLDERPNEILTAFLLQAAAVVLYTAWPLLAARHFSGDRLAWYAAALAGPLWFSPLRKLFVWGFGDDFIGALPIALGALSLAAADRARRAGPSDQAIRSSALVWFAAVALCFVAVAIPLQLEKEWITLGWALEGLAVIALWTRLDHPGLKYFGLALLGAATLRLVANVELLGYYPRSTARIVNWLMYTYLVPAAALLLSASLLKPREQVRARDWEQGLYAGGRPAGAVGAGFAAILVVFFWINLTIADWFATGDRLQFDFGGPPAQRLTVSLAWGIYALLLLGFGMARDALGLRWLSLGLLLVTIGKVFLYDLASLRDLYRVASLLGLAISLMLVSLLYQRFVFRRERSGAS